MNFPDFIFKACIFEPLAYMTDDFTMQIPHITTQNDTHPGGN